MRGVERREGNEGLVAEAGGDPALGDLDANFDLGLLESCRLQPVLLIRRRF
jgi:hypothetical protein